MCCEKQLHAYVIGQRVIYDRVFTNEFRYGTVIGYYGKEYVIDAGYMRLVISGEQIDKYMAEVRKICA